MISKPLYRIAVLLVLLLVVLWLGGCTPYLTQVDYDPNASLQTVRTYAWAPASATAAAPAYQSLDQSRLRQAFAAALAGKGLTPVPAAEAQVWVDLTYRIDRRYETQALYYGYYNWHPWWWGMEPETRLDERDESWLSLVIIDPASRSVIWAGQSTVRYYEALPPDERRQRLEEQVQALLARFPPR